MSSSVSPLLGWACLLVGLAVSPVQAQPPVFESEPILEAASLVQPALLSGPGYSVESRVEVRGYMGNFTINTKVGRLGADSVEILALRIAEVPALEALDKLTQSEAFTQAAGGKFANIAKAFGNVFLHPVQTAVGIPDGVARYLRNRIAKLGNQAQSLSDRATKRITTDGDPYAAGAGPMTDGRDDKPRSDDSPWYGSAGEEVGREVKRQLSYSRMKRDIARQLGIDPYTANPYIHVRLDGLAWVASSGNYAATAALGAISGGAGVAISETSRLSDLVWTMDPDDIRARVFERLQQFVSDEYVIRQFLRRGVYTPTLQLALIDAVEALQPKAGVDRLLELAIGARSELEARFLINGLRMLVADPERKNGGVFMPVGAGFVWQLPDGAIVLPLPVDQLSWTREIAEFFDRPEFRNSHKSVLIAAAASLGSRRELSRRGWNIHTQMRWPDAPPYAGDSEVAPR